MKTKSMLSMPKRDKINMLLDYAKECYKNGHKPTKKEIRKKFHIEIYNYFKNIVDYHQKAGIAISLKNYPRQKARKIIIYYIRQNTKKGNFQYRKEVEEKFKIHLTTYFKNLEDLYKSARVSYFLAERAIKNRILAARLYDENILIKQKSLIKSLIRENVKKGIYLGVKDIQKKLNLSFYNLYKNVREAYESARVEYERPSPILLGRKKEKLLTKIVKDLVLRMGFKIRRISLESKIDFNKKADMTIEDKNSKLYLVEIKAYRSDYHLGKREFSQLLKYLTEEKISEGLFITTCNSQKCGFKKIRFINGEKLVNLLKEYKLTHHLKSIRWIQESVINSQERIRHLEINKKAIINYVKN